MLGALLHVMSWLFWHSCSDTCSTCGGPCTIAARQYKLWQVSMLLDPSWPRVCDAICLNCQTTVWPKQSSTYTFILPSLSLQASVLFLQAAAVYFVSLTTNLKLNSLRSFKADHNVAGLNLTIQHYVTEVGWHCWQEGIKRALLRQSSEEQQPRFRWTDKNTLYTL